MGIVIKHLDLLMLQDGPAHIDRVRDTLVAQGFEIDLVGVDSLDVLRSALASRQWSALIVDVDVTWCRPLEAFELSQALAPSMQILLLNPMLAGDVGMFAWRGRAIECVGLQALDRIGPAVVRGLKAAATQGEPDRDVMPLLAAIDARLAAAEVAVGDAARSEVSRARTLVAAAMLAGCEDLEGDATGATPQAAPGPCSSVAIDPPAATSGGERTLPLTARQLEVLKLIAEGHSTREIATALSLSVKTVESHRAQILLRVGARGVAGLVRYAVRTGLVDANS